MPVYKKHKSFLTYHSATIGFLASVIASMLFKGHQSGELLVAKITIKGFLSGVGAYVDAAEIYHIFVNELHIKSILNSLKR